MRYRYVFNATAETRFWQKVAQQGDCWIWTAGQSKDGYGMFQCGHKPDGRQSKGYAHAITYMWLRGEIPAGLELDHLCRNRLCCNPWHLDPVPGKVNRRRGDTFLAANAAKTHCPKGHPYDEANTRIRPNGKRSCRACTREQRASEAYLAKRRAAYIPHPAPSYNTLKTQCPHGHPYDEGNTVYKSGKRHCRTCVNAQQNARYAARKQQAAARTTAA